MSGTFQLILSTVATKTGTGWQNQVAATDDASLVNSFKSDNSAYIIQNGAPPLSGLISFNCEWYLDGSGVATPFASLPAGFVVTSAILTLQCTRTDAANYNLMTFIMFFAQGLESRDISNTVPDRIVGGKTYYDFTHPLPVPTALHLNTDPIGVSIDRPGPFVGVPTFQYLVVNGTYDISTYTDTWTIDTPGPVKIGDNVTISGDSGLSNITEITIQFGASSVTILAAAFVSQTDTEVVFTIPAGLGSFIGSADFYVTVDAPPDFVGTVLLGALEIIVANASGIYTITPGKTSDTVYIGTGDDTVDVAIPTPFWKTGLLGG